MVSVGVPPALVAASVVVMLFAPLYVVPVPSSASPGVPSMLYGPDTAIVGYRTDLMDSAQSLAAALGSMLVYDNTRLGIAVLHTDDPDAVVAAAQGRADVRYAERDPLVFPEHEPLDIGYASQWGPKAIRGPEAWDVARGAGAVVAVLDTGVDWRHPDLLLSTWFNTGEIPGNGVDDDGNGFRDDFVGWDFSSNDNDPSPTGCGSHGTHVAGIVAATQDNVVGITGMAPHAKVMALRMLCGGSQPTLSRAMQAVQYAAENGADIVTCSWFSNPPSLAFEEMVTWAYNEHNVLFIKSAGNQYGGGVTYPGVLPEFIAVSSIDSGLGISSFSSRGAKVELAAPGGNIYSTLEGNGYGSLSGTSMAAPHVAGTAALVWSLHANLTNEEVRSRLAATARDLGDPGRDIVFGHGLVDAAAAVGV